MPGLQRQRLVVARDRLRRPVERFEHDAIVGQRVGGGGIAAKRGRDQPQRLLRTALLLAQHAEEMQCVEMRGRELEDILIERLRPCERALLVQGHGLLKDAGKAGTGRCGMSLGHRGGH